MSLNQILLIGNCGSDPEMRYTPNGSMVVNFSLAVNSYRNSPEGDQIQETEWFRVSAWNKLAETCNQYVVKGMKVYVEGRFSSREWTDQEGKTRTSLEISCADIQFLSRSNTEQTIQNQNESGTSASDTGGNVSASDTGGNVEDLPW